MSTPPAHQLFVAHVAYGHCRPMLYLALNLLTLHPNLHITYLVARQLESKLVPALARFGAAEQVTGRLHVVFFGQVEDEEGARLVKVKGLGGFIVQTILNFTDAYGKILKGDPLLDTSTSTFIPTFSAPLTRVVADVVFLENIATAKAAIEAKAALHPGRRIGLVSFAPLGSSFVAASVFNPPDSIIPGIYTRCLAVLQAEGNKKTDAEIFGEIAEQNDEIVHVIGGGDIHMYELQPSSARWRAPLKSWLVRLDSLTKTHQDRSIVDGVIVCWVGEFAPEIAEIAKKTFDGFWEVGPQLSPGEWAEDGVKHANGVVEGKRGGGAEFSVEERRGEVMAFLESALEEEGENSVLVISFGSMFAIPLLHQINVLLSTLKELKIRFIFAQGVLSPEIIAEVERLCALSEGRELLVTWIPQNAVLAHPAASFFLTHCGSNSVQESILHGIPMIAWPGAGDQPTIALELSQVHKVAFELLQVRTEYNIGRPTKRGPVVLGTEEAMREEMVDVFTMMRGEEGEAMRKRVGEMREVMVRSCRSEGGRSYEAMRDLGL